MKSPFIFSRKSKPNMKNLMRKTNLLSLSIFVFLILSLISFSFSEESLNNKNNSNEVFSLESSKAQNKELSGITTDEIEAISEIKVFKTNFHDVKGDFVQSTIFFTGMKIKINKAMKEMHLIWNYETPKDLEKTHEIKKIVNSKGKNNKAYFDMTQSDEVFSIKFDLKDKIELIMYHRSEDVGDAYYLKFHKGLSKDSAINKEIHSLPMHNHEESDFEVKFIVSPQDRNINSIRNIFSELFNRKLE